MTTVTTTQGKVRGDEKMDCLQFRGIPFAEPPVGDLRWRAPQPHASWDGERDCTEFGPICPQVSGTMDALTQGNSPMPANPMSEDCLTLNVFTPAADDAKRPVMVWIHGGAFATGSGRLPWYYGHNFARDDVVVVTVNYRLSVLGFLHLSDHFGSDFADSGTLGIQDQIAALQWVQANIESFGGDPDNVTIFGESAGGMSVGTLLGSPVATGLFAKAVPQSGAGHSAHTQEVAARITDVLLSELGVKEIGALQALDVDTLLGAADRIGQSLVSENGKIFGDDFSGAGMAFQPVIGGAVAPLAPIDSIRGGSAAGVPVFVGTTRNEWNLFSLGLDPKAKMSVAVRPLRNLCAKAGKDVDALVGAYENELGAVSDLDMRNAIETDRIFRIPAIRLAEAQIANDSPVWMYRFDWQSPAFKGRFGACHALEIPFVFDNLSAPGIEIFTGGKAPQSLATQVHSAWVAFAKTGDPNADGVPAFAAYDTAKRSTVLFDEECTAASDPDGKIRIAWDGLLEPVWIST